MYKYFSVISDTIANENITLELPSSEKAAKNNRPKIMITKTANEVAKEFDENTTSPK